MKKGFTLIELLAVIAILAIIMIIATPRVLEAIENSRIKAYKNDEKMMIKATQTYFGNNADLLPENIGETVEVTLSDLKTNEFIGEISDQSGNCDGYILVTKTEEGYSYNPQLKCGTSNTISNSTDDGLILHYTFDEFAEPTDNFLSLNQRTVELGDTSGWDDCISSYSWGVASYEATKEEFYEGQYSLKATTAGVKTSEGIGMYNIPCEANSIYTLSLYAKLPIGKDFKLTTGTTIDSSVVSLGHENIVGNGEWQRISVTLDSKTVPFDLRWAFVALAAEPQVYYVDAVQIEKKDYATPFVSGIRNDYIIDHTNSKYNGDLTIADTPKWINKKGNGYYEFAGVNRIQFTQLNLANTFSICSWFKTLQEHQIDTETIVGAPGTIGQNYLFDARFGSTATTSGMGISVGINGISVYEHAADYMPALAVYEGDVGTDWNHVCVVYENKKPSILLNGELVREGLTSQRDNIYIAYKIGLGTYGSFNGLMDEVKIYNRVLSAEEIKYQYDTQKSKYE